MPPTLLTAAGIAGVIIDEWVEKRPSDTQATAVVINYDTPQAEATSCLLLCAADPNPVAGKARFSWTPAAAAERVVQAFDRMRIRAFTTQNTPLIDTVIPNANQVPFRKNGSVDVARVPETLLNVTRQDWFKLSADLEVRQAATDPGAYGTGWNQTGRPNRVRRHP